MGAVIPFTLVVIPQTNKHVLDETLDSGSPENATPLPPMGRLHAVRSGGSVVSHRLAPT